MDPFADRVEKDLIGGFLHLMILAAIDQRGPIHGYGLIKALIEEVGRPDAFKEGIIYPILNALERDGLVRSEWAAGTNGPARKYYQLTGAGRTSLNQARRTWDRLSIGFESIVKKEQKA